MRDGLRTDEGDYDGDAEAQQPDTDNSDNGHPSGVIKRQYERTD